MRNLKFAKFCSTFNLKCSILFLFLLIFISTKESSGSPTSPPPSFSSSSSSSSSTSEQHRKATVDSDETGSYLLGVGTADVTGGIAEFSMMGYATPNQRTNGIHTRLFSRAFIFGSSSTKARLVFVSVDSGMIDTLLKEEVLRKLHIKFGNIYTRSNVLLSSTHTHSGAGGFIQYALYSISSLGFYASNFNAIVDGIVESIDRAHLNLQPGRIYVNKGIVEGAGINRSPTAYLANPEEERARYPHNVDKEMVLLRLETLDGVPLGVINWFAVHPTSMNNTNTLISGDNKGYASMLFEYKMNPEDRPGKGKFVAAFASSNLGDVSPNTFGPKCIDTGEDCDFHKSSCGGSSQKCIASGPGKDMEESTKIIGEKQFQKAFELFENLNGKAELVYGPLEFVSQQVDMSNYEVTLLDHKTGEEQTVRTCKAALGYSFAAGTTDGPGMFDFTQGTLSGSMLWDSVRNFIRSPSQETIDCQKPKPIILAVGESDYPYEWVPKIVETQVLRIGNIYVLGVPGEFTTMAGRRLRNVVKSTVDLLSPAADAEVVIAGLSNVYTHYITTPEEYSVQRYEGASVLYGKHTLDAYLNQYPYLVSSMISGSSIDKGPSPPNLMSKQVNLNPPVFFDLPPLMKSFGDVISHPKKSYLPGEIVKVTFVSGHLKNDNLRNLSFLLVEKFNVTTKSWSIVRTDADWDTKIKWRRPYSLSPVSEVEIIWNSPKDLEGGTYRIRHFGYYKPLTSKEPKSYEGVSDKFEMRGRINSNQAIMREYVESRKMKQLTVSDFWRNLIQGRSEKEKAITDKIRSKSK